MQVQSFFLIYTEGEKIIARRPGSIEYFAPGSFGFMRYCSSQLLLRFEMRKQQTRVLAVGDGNWEMAQVGNLLVPGAAGR